VKGSLALHSLRVTLRAVLTVDFLLPDAQQQPHVVNLDGTRR
jgi:hypothetical protein